MKEIILKIAGENKKRSHNLLFEKNDEITNLKKISGLYEEEGDEKIYIHRAEDIEKFYHALVEALSEDANALKVIKEVFNKTIY